VEYIFVNKLGLELGHSATSCPDGQICFVPKLRASFGIFCKHSGSFGINTSGISFCEKCQQLQTSKFFIFVPPILGFGPGIGEKAREFH
jgi:hypothetical protein